MERGNDEAFFDIERPVESVDELDQLLWVERGNDEAFFDTERPVESVDDLDKFTGLSLI